MLFLDEIAQIFVTEIERWRVCNLLPRESVIRSSCFSYFSLKLPTVGRIDPGFSLICELVRCLFLCVVNVKQMETFMLCWVSARQFLVFAGATLEADMNICSVSISCKRMFCQSVTCDRLRRRRIMMEERVHVQLTLGWTDKSKTAILLTCLHGDGYAFCLNG